MTAAPDMLALKDVMVVLGTAAVVVPIMHRLKVSPVLGFLLAGAVLGPHGLAQLRPYLPPLEWITVGNEKGLGLFGEVGVVLLLFLIGLELSVQRLITMRRLVFGLGGLQLLLSALVIGAIALVAGAEPVAAVLFGSCLALSSTAIVLEVLSGQGRMGTATGRASFSVLLFQDLAVVPLLMLIPLLGAGGGGSLTEGLVRAFGQAVLVITLIWVLGSVLLKPLFRLVASAQSAELFMAAVLLVAVGSGVATAASGLSMALGAFVAGLLLAETEYRRAIEHTLDPFKGLLLGAFFFSVGMGIDLTGLIVNPLPVFAGTFALVAVKSTITALLMRAFGFPWQASVKSGLLLGPGGEFAFILVGLALSYALIPAAAGAYVLAVTSMSMALIPLFDAIGKRIGTHLDANTATPVDPALSILPPPEDLPRAIVIGHGRVGELVSDMLARHKVKHVVTERAANLVTEARREGKPVYYGDGKNTDFLNHCGLRTAKAVIITIHSWGEIDDLVAAVRSQHPKVVIVSRARDAEHARHLYEVGVTDAVPETIEASLQLSEAALVGLGVPTGPVIASIHEKRDEFRAALQSAAARSGQISHGLRAKQRPAGK